MQIAINITHTFEEPESFAVFAQRLKALFSDFLSAGPHAGNGAVRTAVQTPNEVQNGPESAPNLDQPETAEETAAATNDAALPPVAGVTPRRRGRRTNAEVAAEKAAEAQLPIAGSFGGAPNAVSAPAAPAPQPVALAGPSAPEAWTKERMHEVFAAIYIHPDSEPQIAEILTKHKLSRMRDASPEQIEPITRDLLALQARLTAKG